MQHYLSAAITCIVAVELFLVCPIAPAIEKLLQYSGRANRVVTSRRISDHWKEKVLLRYAAIIATHSLKIAFWLLLILGLVVLVSQGLDWLLVTPASTLDWFATYSGAAIATIFSIFYYWARSRSINAFRRKFANTQ